MTGSLSLDRVLWFMVVIALTLIGLVWGLRDTRRVIEAPFLYAVGMAILMDPQYYIAVMNPGRVPDEAFWVYSVMVLLCSVAFYWGYFSKPRKTRTDHRARTLWTIRDKRLFRLGGAIAALGALGYWQVYKMGDISEWRGWPVYWVTLSKLIGPGISLMLISYYQSGKAERLVVALVFSIPSLLAVVNAGRRSATIMLPLMYLLPFLIYHPKWRLPRPAILGAGVVVFIVVYALPYWRGEFASGHHLEAMSERPLSVVLEDVFSGEKVLETLDSMVMAGAHFRTGYYEWGLMLYNSIIEAYVPGSLIGHDLKDALRIGQGMGVDWMGAAYGIKVAYYTGKSAYAELFGQFSFFGALFFFLVARLFRRTRDAIVQYRDGRAVIFLCFFITIPPSLPWSQVLYGLSLQVPTLLIMVLAFRWCLARQVLLTSDSICGRTVPPAVRPT